MIKAATRVPAYFFPIFILQLLVAMKPCVVTFHSFPCSAPENARTDYALLGVVIHKHGILDGLFWSLRLEIEHHFFRIQHTDLEFRDRIQKLTELVSLVIL